MAWDYRCSEHEVPERWLDTASAWEGRGGADEVSVLRLRAEGSHAERDFGVALVPSGIGDGDCGGEPHLRCLPSYFSRCPWFPGESECGATLWHGVLKQPNISPLCYGRGVSGKRRSHA